MQLRVDKVMTHFNITFAAHFTATEANKIEKQQHKKSTYGKFSDCLQC